ncbi:MAG: 50S ribosomal protein L20 [Candidatus Marinimicrobia bacterium]|nr:50S ribosomal protein L20 [Candidatus Neomarinimicrobiota bacterium]
MPRSNSSVPRHRRHRKILKLAKGYYGTRSRNYRTAKDAVTRALTYSYRDRRQRKRQFRRLWITRINAAARQNGVSYSIFMRGLSSNGIELNRKILADLAVYDPDSFTALVKTVS